VSWSGYQTDADLVRSYQEAGVLVLPSRYEGFGLPALEAMACGTPVVCGDIPALREIAGDAALFVAPDDASEMAREIRRVLTDDALAADLSRRGIANARKYSWEQTARRTLDAYRRAAEENWSVTGAVESALRAEMRS
jgi:glycosyltransferase involved in cell wall biosynthesis